MIMTEAVLPNALAWAKDGHGVFPLWWPVTHNGQTVCACGRLCGKQAAKHPIARYAPHGHLSATTNDDTIKQLWELCVPQANLAVATEKLVVIDNDPRHGGDESLAALEREHGELPKTWQTLTGGGGEHRIYAAPDGVVITSFAAENEIRFGREPPLGPGIDVRARGGYIVAPGSTHISGRRYEWSVDHHPQDTPIAPAPDWMIKRLTARRTATSPDGAPIEPLPSDFWAQLTRQPVTEYCDEAATKIIGHLLRRGCDYQLTLGLMHAWNTAWCKPPLGYLELKRIVDRIANREAARIEAQLKRGDQ
jgi:hypothetical protein